MLAMILTVLINLVLLRYDVHEDQLNGAGETFSLPSELATLLPLLTWLHVMTSLVLVLVFLTLQVGEWRDLLCLEYSFYSAQQAPILLFRREKEVSRRLRNFDLEWCNKSSVSSNSSC